MKQVGNYVSNMVVMIRPFNFRSNQMTVGDNYYQKKSSLHEQGEIHKKSLEEFDRFHQLLKDTGIQVIVVQDQGKNNTPDSVFPNNWVSFQNKGQYILYPMNAPNRRLQRDIDIFEVLRQNQVVPQLLRDYSHYQHEDAFLEGTGSMVLDRLHRIAYAALSPRTHQNVFLKFCHENNYKACFFKAYQWVNGKRQLIYHTNVMMWLGQDVVFICLESINDLKEREAVVKQIENSKKAVVELSEEQISNFAGNCLMLAKDKGQGKVVVMSKRAFDSYKKQQIQKINTFASIVYSSLETIEKYGGGSARCMLAEIF